MPDTRGISKFICSVESEELCAEWTAAINSAVCEAVPPSALDMDASDSQELPEGSVTYRMVHRAVVRAGFEMDSEQVGILETGTVVEMHEHRRNDNGQVRVRTGADWDGEDGAKTVGWTSLTSRDGVEMMVVHDPEGLDEPDDEDEMVVVEALQRSDSHLQRVHGHTRVQSVGTYVAFWGNSQTKTRGRRLRYAAWLQRVSKSGGRSERVDCKVKVRQVNPNFADAVASSTPRDSEQRRRRGEWKRAAVLCFSARRARKLSVLPSFSSNTGVT